MNKVKLLSAALMALALTACNDDPIADNNPLGPAGSTEGQFIGVSITNAANYGSRALGDQNYETGTAAENKIDDSQLHFLFFDRNGDPFIMDRSESYGDGVDVDTPFDKAGESNWIKPVKLAGQTNNVQFTNTGTANAVLILGNATNAYKGVRPSRLICIANVDDATIIAKYVNKSIPELLQEFGDDNTTNAPIHTTLTTPGKDGKENFIMASSTYFDGTTVRCWSDITDRNFRSQSSEAMQNPVQIFVERLAAKVSIAALPEKKVVMQEDADELKPLEFTYSYVEDGAVKVSDPVNVVVNPLGYIVNNKARQNFGLKHLMNGNNSSSFFAKADDFNKGYRSFWASTSSYHEIQQFLPNDFTAPENAFTNGQYLFANTSDPFLEGDDNVGVDSYRGNVNFARSYATKLLVGVNLYTVPVGTEDVQVDVQQPAQLMLWGGMYFTPEALCMTLEEDNTGTVLTAAEKAAGWKICYARVATNSRDPKTGHCHVTFYKTTRNELAHQNITQANGGLPNYTNESLQRISTNNVPAALYWNGMGYYIINIANNTYATKLDEQPLMYGVVRNHSYVYNLTNYVGLGTPVTNPNIPTEPENPSESDGYIAAKLNVLDWRVIHHNTTLQ